MVVCACERCTGRAKMKTVGRLWLRVGQSHSTAYTCSSPTRRQCTLGHRLLRVHRSLAQAAQGRRSQGLWKPHRRNAVVAGEIPDKRRKVAQDDTIATHTPHKDTKNTAVNPPQCILLGCSNTVCECCLWAQQHRSKRCRCKVQSWAKEEW